jgi:hypothetical protein
MVWIQPDQVERFIDDYAMHSPQRIRGYMTFRLESELPRLLPEVVFIGGANAKPVSFGGLMEINEVPVFSMVNIAEIFHRALAKIFQGGQQAVPELDRTFRWFEFVMIQSQVLKGER